MNTLAISGFLRLSGSSCTGRRAAYMKKIERIAIMGAGLMGHGIAQVFLGYPEYQVTLYDTIRGILDAAPGKIRTNVQSMGGTHWDLSRLRLTDSLADAVSKADIVIEAIPEKLDLKRQFFADVEKLATPECIFASN